MFKIYNLLIFEIHIVCIFPTKKKKKVKKQKLETKGSLEEKKKKVGGEEAKPVSLGCQFLSSQPEGRHSANENNVLLS